eukprot:365042-Chlamydomonas_euryale.AAC.43
MRLTGSNMPCGALVAADGRRQGDHSVGGPGEAQYRKAPPVPPAETGQSVPIRLYFQTQRQCQPLCSHPLIAAEPRWTGSIACKIFFTETVLYAM